MVGDRVLMAPGQGRGGIVQEVLPRCSALIRPAVANVDQAVIVFSLRNPEPNPGLLERFLIAAALNGIKPVICFNKVDLMDKDQIELLSRYRGNYNVVVTSAKTGEGLTSLRETLSGKISVFAGPSGVGKSTLLNSIIPGLKQKTGEVSAKLKSGKHTTRHIELIPLIDGVLWRTPRVFQVWTCLTSDRRTWPDYFPALAIIKQVVISPAACITKNRAARSRKR
jgi:ribosome biogenesis GTPase